VKQLSVILGIAALIAFGFAVQPAQAATVGGVVISADGNGVANAMVVIQQLDVRRGQRPYAARIASGRGGIFVFDNVPAGRYSVSTVTRQGSARAQIAVRADDAVRVRLALQGRRGGRGGGDER
jgi:hypothetical protein